MVSIQLDGELVCGNCFCASRAVVDGPIAILKLNADGRVVDAFEARMEDGKIVPPFWVGNKRDVAMNFVDRALQVVLTLLIIELGWGIAVLIAWAFHSIIVFYAVGLIATAGSVGFSFHYFAEAPTRQSEEPTDII
jgi:hypothetical protein